MNSLAQIPLCIDLDGTLSPSDTLAESVCGVLKKSPLSAFLFPIWLLKGRAHLKGEFAKRFQPDAKLLPIHPEILEYARAQKQAGRKLVLVTAADRAIAEAVQKETGLFDEVIASDGTVNLSGKNKAAELESRFGAKGFDYIGNSHVDLPVWQAARVGHVVSSNASLIGMARKVATMDRVFDAPSASLKTWAHALRVHQWAKNLLLLVPLAGAHKWTDLSRAGSTLLGMMAFSICASSVYLLNDLLDLESDRHHPSKRFRPLASGAIPILHALALVPVLLVIATGLAAKLDGGFLAIFGLYYGLTLLYSFVIKQVGLLDVLVLAGLYAIRIQAGGYAARVPVSDWLLLFSIFVFLSLAFAKRYTELKGHRAASEQIKGRGYSRGDAELLSTMGVGSGYLSVLVLGLYVSNPAVIELYHRPRVLWLVCPVLLHWISRVWLLAHRGRMHDDPILFALRDPQSWLSALLIAIIGAFAGPT